MTPLDPRLSAFRPDLADARLRGKVEATRFVEGEPRRVVAATAPIKRTPRADASLESEALRGEVFTVFEDAAEGWSWGQLQTDGYVGYVPTDALGALPPEPTHRINALRAFVFPGPDMKLPVVAALSFGSRVALGRETVTRGTAYGHLVSGEGAIAAAAAVPIATPPAADFVAVAERFLGVAYLWGGRTSLGVDCSSLVQLAFAAAGKPAPRDTDLQEKMLGALVPGGVTRELRRGDLVFWKGHVGIMSDGATMVHASGHHLAVVTENLAAAVARIAANGSRPTSVRRP